MKNFLLCFFVSVGLLAGVANAVDVSEIDQLEPYYQKPGLDLSAYSKVLVAPLDLSTTFVVPPPWVTPAARATQRWALTAEDKKWLRESYQKSVRSEIGQSFEIVEEPGEGVLIFRIELVSIMPFARKGEDVQTQGFGILVAQAQLRDGSNGDLLAIYEGPQRIGNEYQQNTRLNSEKSLKHVFEIWGARVNLFMESFAD
jgi:hypothetical protein